jgi:hypothetical protein
MTTHQEGTGLPVGGDGAPTFRDVAVQGVIEFLDRVGAGTVSGNMADYPQLRAACRYAAKTLRKLEAAPAAPEPVSGEGFPTPSTPSQASQEAAEVEDAVRAILAAVRDAARGYHNTQQWGESEYGQPSYWEMIKQAEETAIKVVRAALSHPPKGGPAEEWRANLAALNDVGEIYHAIRLNALYFLRPDQLRELSKALIPQDGAGEGGPVARGGLPDAARLGWRSRFYIAKLALEGLLKEAGSGWVASDDDKIPLEDTEAYKAAGIALLKVSKLPLPDDETPQASGEASEPAPEPHVPRGYMEEANCRECGKPMGDPSHIGLIGKLAPASPAKPSQGRPMKLEARVTGRSAIGYWINIDINGEAGLEVDCDDPKIAEEIAYRINAFEAEVVEPQERGEGAK